MCFWRISFKFEGCLHCKLALEQKLQQISDHNPRLIIVCMNKSDNMQLRMEGTRISLRSPLTSTKTHSIASLSPHSSSDLSSNYLRYLSHLTAEQPSDGQDDYHTYWDVVTKCLLYLKREHLNDDYHDELLCNLLKQHFQMERLDPTPLSEIGKSLLRCGYFLAAYAVLLLRIRGSGRDLLEYFRMSFSKYRISCGETELKWYLGADCAYTQQLLARCHRQGRKDKDSPFVRASTCDTNISP